MNQYFFESRGREKIRELRKEGQLNQAIRKISDGTPKPNVLRNAPKLAVGLLAILGVMRILGI